MADELSTPTVSRWGYVVLDYIGLGFILVGPEELVRIGSWKMPLIYVCIGAVFLFLGIMGPKIKVALMALLPWVRMKRELETALLRIEELKKTQRPSVWETLTEPHSLSVDGPDLKVEYKKTGSERPRLIFKIRSGAPTTIRKVGPLVSEETYRTENDFILLQDVIPEVEVNQPVERQISCVKNATSGDMVQFQDALEAGGSTVTDSVVIEYTSENRQFSRRFFLCKNVDGSIVWSTENRQSTPRDLRWLRAKLHSLQIAPSDLTYAGELRLLIAQSIDLQKTLLDILASNANPLLGLGPALNLTHPMSREVIILDDSDRDKALPWQRMRMMSFRDRYKAYNEYCKDARVPQLPFVLNDLNITELCDAFDKQQDFIRGIYDDIVKRYK